jgi:5-methylcytosine-specific restriction endonuclease McrA
MTLFLGDQKNMRDYKKEYKEFHGTSEQKDNRVKRNNARREALRTGKARKNDGTEVDHIKPLSKGGSNGKSNRRLVSRSVNRKKGAK